VTPAPMIQLPSTLNVVAGSTVRFSVNVTDSDLSRTVILTASGLPPGATFNTALGTGSFTGVLSWAPSDSQASHDYNVTFTADDGHEGVAVAYMTIHVNPRAQAAPLLSGSQYWFLGLAGFGVAVMSPFLLRIVRRTVSKGKTALLSTQDQ
jgi:Putative Ig domain